MIGIIQQSIRIHLSFCSKIATAVRQTKKKKSHPRKKTEERSRQKKKKKRADFLSRDVIYSRHCHARHVAKLAVLSHEAPVAFVRVARELLQMHSSCAASRSIRTNQNRHTKTAGVCVRSCTLLACLVVPPILDASLYLSENEKRRVYGHPIYSGRVYTFRETNEKRRVCGHPHLFRTPAYTFRNRLGAPVEDHKSVTGDKRMSWRPIQKISSTSMIFWGLLALFA